MLNRTQLPKSESDSEPRTMQFLMERSCKEMEHLIGPLPRWVPPLPIAFEVLFDPHHTPMMCGGKTWLLLSPQYRREDGSLGRLAKFLYNAAVCEHMGHLVE